jgi:hypothetical protein
MSTRVHLGTLGMLVDGEIFMTMMKKRMMMMMVVKKMTMMVIMMV